MRKTMLKRRRFDKVGVGQVVTVNSAVVGDGRRTWRCGAVVSIFLGSLGAVATCIAPDCSFVKRFGVELDGLCAHIDSIFPSQWQ